MAIKMRVNVNRESRCENCNSPWKTTPEMYDVLIVNSKTTLCKKCSDELFNKLLKISCMYNAKVKSKEDMQRITTSAKILNPVKGVQEKHPDCFGEFVKKKKCKQCKYLSECRDAYEDKQWEDVE